MLSPCFPVFPVFPVFAPVFAEKLSGWRRSQFNLGIVAFDHDLLITLMKLANLPLYRHLNRAWL